MSFYKSDSDQEIQVDDPIERIKNLRSVRGKKIERRMQILIGIAFVGMVLMLAPHHGAGVVEISRFGKSRIPDTSFKQRVCIVWYDLFFASFLTAFVVGLRAKLSDFLSHKARTPCLLIGAIGLGVLLYAAAGLFSRPYTGAELDIDRYFIGGWFLVFCGIVFRK